MDPSTTPAGAPETPEWITPGKERIVAPELARVAGAIRALAGEIAPEALTAKQLLGQVQRVAQDAARVLGDFERLWVVGDPPAFLVDAQKLVRSAQKQCKEFAAAETRAPRSRVRPEDDTALAQRVALIRASLAAIAADAQGVLTSIADVQAIVPAAAGVVPAEEGSAAVRSIEALLPNARSGAAESGSAGARAAAGRTSVGPSGAGPAPGAPARATAGAPPPDPAAPPPASGGGGGASTVPTGSAIVPYGPAAIVPRAAAPPAAAPPAARVVVRPVAPAPAPPPAAPAPAAAPKAKTPAEIAAEQQQILEERARIVREAGERIRAILPNIRATPGHAVVLNVDEHVYRRADALARRNVEDALQREPSIIGRIRRSVTMQRDIRTERERLRRELIAAARAASGSPDAPSGLAYTRGDAGGDTEVESIIQRYEEALAPVPGETTEDRARRVKSALSLREAQLTAPRFEQLHELNVLVVRYAMAQFRDAVISDEDFLAELHGDGRDPGALARLRLMRPGIAASRIEFTAATILECARALREQLQPAAERQRELMRAHPDEKDAIKQHCTNVAYAEAKTYVLQLSVARVTDVAAHGTPPQTQRGLRREARARRAAEVRLRSREAEAQIELRTEVQEEERRGRSERWRSARLAHRREVRERARQQRELTNPSGVRVVTRPMADAARWFERGARRAWDACRGVAQIVRGYAEDVAQGVVAFLTKEDGAIRRTWRRAEPYVTSPTGAAVGTFAATEAGARAVGAHAAAIVGTGVVATIAAPYATVGGIAALSAVGAGVVGGAAAQFTARWRDERHRQMLAEYEAADDERAHDAPRGLPRAQRVRRAEIAQRIEEGIQHVAASGDAAELAQRTSLLLELLAEAIARRNVGEIEGVNLLTSPVGAESTERLDLAQRVHDGVRVLGALGQQQLVRLDRRVAERADALLLRTSWRRRLSRVATASRAGAVSLGTALVGGVSAGALSHVVGAAWAAPIVPPDVRPGDVARRIRAAAQRARQRRVRRGAATPLS